MSAFLAVNYGDRIELLTDGAVYTEDGTLITTREKVLRIGSIRCAVTCRGDIEVLDKLGFYLKIIARLTGSYDKTVEKISGYLAIAKTRNAEPRPSEIIICGISEASGPVIEYFCTVPAYQQFEPFKLYRIETPDFGGGGYPGMEADLTSSGITPESVSHGLAGRGADILELMRGTPGPNPTRPDLPDVYGVGGHVDLTVIRGDGVTTKRLRTWSDRIGEKINPFAEVA